MIAITEVFQSIQGEGATIGRPSIFIRLAGCNLTCVWCDTKYTWLYSQSTLERLQRDLPENMLPVLGNTIYSKEDEIKNYEIQELFQLIKSMKSKNVIITGGEPMLQKQQVIELANLLLASNFTIEIETNGTISPKHLPAETWFNVSPKLSNSYNPYEKRVKPLILQEYLEYKGIFKFVVSSPADLEEIEELVHVIGIPEHRIYLMPEGRDREQLQENSKWLVQTCIENGYNYSHRLHIELFGDKRGV